MKYIFKHRQACENASCEIGNLKYWIVEYRGDVFHYRDYGPYKYAFMVQRVKPHREFDFGCSEAYKKWLKANDLQENYVFGSGNQIGYELYAVNCKAKHRDPLWVAIEEISTVFIKDEADEIIGYEKNYVYHVREYHPLKLIQDEFEYYKDCKEFADAYLNRLYIENNNEQLSLF